ncbi:MAG: hypothetical protein KGM99_00545 [Burkholderiales bacterium]|nr:hypothetical protein [Burkholderiales bacterium]
MQLVDIPQQASAANLPRASAALLRQLAVVLVAIGMSMLETSLRFPVLLLIDISLRQSRDQALSVATRLRAVLPCPSLSKENSHV